MAICGAFGVSVASCSWWLRRSPRRTARGVHGVTARAGVHVCSCRPCEPDPRRSGWLPHSSSPRFPATVGGVGSGVSAHSVTVRLTTTGRMPRLWLFVRASHSAARCSCHLRALCSENSVRMPCECRTPHSTLACPLTPHPPRSARGCGRGWPGHAVRSLADLATSARVHAAEMPVTARPISRVAVATTAPLGLGELGPRLPYAEQVGPVRVGDAIERRLLCQCRV